MKTFALTAIALLLAATAVHAQGYPPQILPGIGLMPGLPNSSLALQQFEATQQEFMKFMSNDDVYRNPYTGNSFHSDYGKYQWIGPGGAHVQTWNNVVPPGWGWMQAPHW